MSADPHFIKAIRRSLSYYAMHFNVSTDAHTLRAGELIDLSNLNIRVKGMSYNWEGNYAPPVDSLGCTRLKMIIKSPPESEWNWFAFSMAGNSSDFIKRNAAIIIAIKSKPKLLCDFPHSCFFCVFCLKVLVIALMFYFIKLRGWFLLHACRCILPMNNLRRRKAARV